jgi:hypothetical protein
MKVTPNPAGFSSWPNRHYAWQNFLPRGYGHFSSAIHEYLGWVFYKVAY